MKIFGEIIDAIVKIWPILAINVTIIIILLTMYFFNIHPPLNLVIN